MVARIQISYILSRCAAAENTGLMTSGFSLGQSALYFCCSTPGQDITNTYIHTYIHTYVHMYIRTFIQYVQRYVRTYTHTCIHTYVCTQAHIQRPVPAHTYIRTYMCHGVRVKVGWIKEYRGLMYINVVALLL